MCNSIIVSFIFVFCTQKQSELMSSRSIQTFCIEYRIAQHVATAIADILWKIMKGRTDRMSLSRWLMHVIGKICVIS